MVYRNVLAAGDIEPLAEERYPLAGPFRNDIVARRQAGWERAKLGQRRAIAGRIGGMSA